eukprot:953636-Prorocentrum_minimum.AAC.1
MTRVLNRRYDPTEDGVEATAPRPPDSLQSAEFVRLRRRALSSFVTYLLSIHGRPKVLELLAVNVDKMQYKNISPLR